MKKMRWLSLCLMFVMLWSVSALASSDLQRVVPEEVGLSSARVERIEQALQRAVDNEEVAGAVAMVLRHGKVAYVGTVGMADREAQEPMTAETIFRIASMTKPITTVAAMMLYEEGHFLLNDPLSKFIPEFKNPEVLVVEGECAGATTKTVPAKREITMRHLMNHTSGLTYQFMGKPFLAKMYKEAGVHDALGPMEGTLEEKVEILAGLPLAHHPGDKWDYGLGLDVLGRVVEIKSEMPLDEIFHTRIFEPLGMEDTYFYLPSDKADRLAAVYGRNEQGKLVKLGPGPYERWGGFCTFTTDFIVSEPQTYFSGGSGLVSTIDDYAKFSQMMLNGGELNGVRLLGRKTVELMTQNSIGDDYILWHDDFGDKFGYGFGIRTRRGQYDQLESLGTYTWGGIFYTRFWIDPVEDMITIFLSQFDVANQPNTARTFRVMAYQAIVD